MPAAAVVRTPLLLRATAGLRLLPESRAAALLQTARAEAGRSGFLTAPDAVRIMSGTDEGLFSWFTVNFLLGGSGRRFVLGLFARLATAVGSHRRYASLFVSLALYGPSTDRAR